MEAIVYIFSPQMEAIVLIILQIFYATRAVLKIGEYPRMDYNTRYTTDFYTTKNLFIRIPDAGLLKVNSTK